MKHLSRFVAAMWLVLALLLAGASPSPAAALSWSLSSGDGGWSDEFNQSSGEVDQNLWDLNTYFGGSFANGDAAICPTNYSESGGALTIWTTKLTTPFIGKNYCAGTLTSVGRHYNTANRYIEFRYKWPNPQKGIDAAIWDFSWPQPPHYEGDWNESAGSLPGELFITLHNHFTSGSYAAFGQCTPTPPNFGDGNFHTEGVLWTATAITVYVDGTQVCTTTPSQATTMNAYGTGTPDQDIIQTLMQAVINTSVNEEWQTGNKVDANTTFPSAFVIDYYRSYAPGTSGISISGVPDPVDNVRPALSPSPEVYPVNSTISKTTGAAGDAMTFTVTIVTNQNEADFNLGLQWKSMSSGNVWTPGSPGPFPPFASSEHHDMVAGVPYTFTIHDYLPGGSDTVAWGQVVLFMNQGTTSKGIIAQMWTVGINTPVGKGAGAFPSTFCDGVGKDYGSTDATPLPASCPTAPAPVPTPTPPPAPTLTFSASASSINAGDTSSLIWNALNASSCTASGGWTGSEALSGTLARTPVATTTYTLDCIGAGGEVTRSVTVTVNATGATKYVSSAAILNADAALQNLTVSLTPQAGYIKSTVAELYTARTAVAALHGASIPSYSSSGPVWITSTLPNRLITQIGTTQTKTRPGYPATSGTAYAAAQTALAALATPDP